MANISIDPYMDVINKYARVGYAHMKKPSTYSFEDMVQEGRMVFFKDAIKGYSTTGKASFKSYLCTCLRNHFVGLMKKSFRNSPEANRMYTQNRIRRMTVISPVDAVVSSITIEEMAERLNNEEIEYINLLQIHKRKEIRQILGISAFKERKLRKCMAGKIK